MLALILAILIPFVNCVELRDVGFEMVGSLDGESGVLYNGANYSSLIDCGFEATSTRAEKYFISSGPGGFYCMFGDQSLPSGKWQAFYNAGTLKKHCNYS